MSETKTDGIRIVVNSEYIPDRSNPTKNRFFYAYHITIHNEGSEPAKLLGRYWHITDGNNHIEEVRGPGVVGQQPIIQPNKIFKYSSFCPLRTPFGVMHGYFQMENSNGDQFNALISPFRFIIPEYLN